MYYTTRPRTDGFGAQFQNIIIDILYTYNATTNQYVFPNIASFEHNYTNDHGFTDRLMRYMNLRKHFSMPSGVADTIHDYSLDVTIYSYSYFDNNVTQLLASPTMNLIKSLFYADKNTPFDTMYYNVAVHIRRDNKCDSRISGITSDKYYLNVMKYIRANHGADEKPLRFHIYSQCNDQASETSCKEKFMNKDTEFHINGDVLPTFHGMVFADALVTSASSYSYCAAFLCNGVIYYKKFWHKPANNWIVADDISS